MLAVRRLGCGATNCCVEHNKSKALRLFESRLQVSIFNHLNEQFSAYILGTEMETGAAYLISVGIIAFGIWVVAGAIAAGSPLAWTLGGLITVAIGSFSFFLQCKGPAI
jgi:hypothetical protein